MLPRHSLPRTLPATRTTNRALQASLKISSVGTRASEQPSTTAKGRCRGALPAVSPMPTSDRSKGLTRVGEAAPSGRSRRPEKARLPAHNRSRASAEVAGGAGGGAAGSKRYTMSIIAQVSQPGEKGRRGPAPAAAWSARVPVGGRFEAQEGQ